MKRIWEVNRQNREVHILRKGQTWDVDGEVGYAFEEDEKGRSALILPNGSRVRVEAVRNGREIWVDLDGRSFRLLKKEYVGAESADAETQSGDLLAPMTGKITAIHVEVGTEVEPGRVLAEMEAMKMQYSLKAPIQGRIDEIFAEVGEVLDVDEIVLRIKGEE